MKAKKAVIIIFSLIYVALIVVFGFSWSNHNNQEIGLVTPIFGKPKVVFSAGSFPVDSEELTVVLAPGESALLNDFPGLKSADLSGSECLDEILEWSQAHPDVSLRYTVAMPDGSTVDNSAQSLDLSGFSAEDASAALELCRYLPALREIELGTLDAKRLVDGGAMSALMEALPEVTLDYTCTVAGQRADKNTESLNLSGMNHEDAALAAQLLPGLSKLKTVELGCEGDGGVSWEDIGMLQAACPQITFSYGFNRFGKDLNINFETVDLNHITMNDEGAEVRAFLPYMKNCTYLDMDFCNVSNEAMNSIRQDYPDIKVVWRIWFADAYSVRTDVERILASKPSKGGMIDNEDAKVLAYCTDVKYLDLGHNDDITDISFVRSMPKLEVFTIALTNLEDISPLADCPHLEHLMLNDTKVTDLSPLSGLTELRHINIGDTPVPDISPLYSLTELERLWIGCNTPVPAEQVEEMQRCAPNCEINNTTWDPEGGGWRVIGYTALSLALYEETGWLQDEYAPRYKLLREQLGFGDGDYAFTWNDPKY